METFGYDREDRRLFWSKVFFGNYVDIPCGVGDTQAEAAIRANKQEYNRELFDFIAQKQIDYVFCFSRLVYNNLPVLNIENGDFESCELDGHTHYLMKRVYSLDSMNAIGIHCDKKITVYGLRHTSRGYSVKKYKDAITKIINTGSLLHM